MPAALTEPAPIPPAGPSAARRLALGLGLASGLLGVASVALATPTIASIRAGAPLAVDGALLAALGLMAAAAFCTGAALRLAEPDAAREAAGPLPRG